MGRMMSWDPLFATWKLSFLVIHLYISNYLLGYCYLSSESALRSLLLLVMIFAATGVCLQIFLMSSSYWDIFLLPSKEQSTEWSVVFAVVAPLLLAVFSSSLQVSPSSKSPGANLRHSPLLCSASCSIFVFPLKFEKISLASRSHIGSETISWITAPHWGSGCSMWLEFSDLAGVLISW